MQNGWYSVSSGSFFLNCPLNAGIPHRLPSGTLSSQYCTLTLDDSLTLMDSDSMYTPSLSYCHTDLSPKPHATFPTTFWASCPTLNAQLPSEAHPSPLFMSINSTIHLVIQNQAGFGHPKAFPLSSNIQTITSNQHSLRSKIINSLSEKS